MRPRASVPRLATGALVLLVCAGLVLVLSGGGGRPSDAQTPALRANPNVGPFQGLGVWVDLYDESAWADPSAAVEDMSAHGVQTLYLQTSNFQRNLPIVDRAGVGAFLDASAGLGVRVVAWYLPGFREPVLDRSRSVAAMRFTSPGGHHFDGFGLDIESPEVRKTELRTRRLLRLSQGLRDEGGAQYPLGAIVPSPRGMQRNGDYWPRFPFAELGAVYDAFLPMTYFTFRVHGEAAARAYAARCIRLLRAWVGSDRVPIHMIGGIAQDATTAETRGFVRAVREAGLVGASYYTWPGITAGQWDELSTISP